MNKLTIGYFYKDSLNLYGDNGNVEILAYRAAKRGFEVEIVILDENTNLTQLDTFQINLVFMGGGPDSSQRTIYKDLLENKGNFLSNYIENAGVGLYICGSYQLLGNYYKDAEGNELKGLGIFDLYTKHFGKSKPRCIGNTVAKLSSKILNDPIYQSLKSPFDTLVGFENHGGRTYLKEKENSFATVVKGHGNNSEDKTEGYMYKNSIGSYFHGPILSKNPHLADYLLAKALKLDTLDLIDDSLINSAHTALLKK